MFDARCSFFFFLLLSTSAVYAATSTQPATAPVTQPTAANLEAHEWAVFVIDGSTGQLNPDGIVTATLPAFVNDKRYGSPSAPAAEPAQNPLVIRRLVRAGAAASPRPPTGADMDQPSPVGVIRLIGKADGKVDVSVTAKGGNFVGSGPKAQDRTNQLLWRDITVSDAPVTPLAIAGPGNWFTRLRSVDSAYVSMDHVGCDKFLVYDLQMPGALPLKIKSGADFSADVSNTGAGMLHDLTLYQADHDAWRSASIGELPVIHHPAPATTAVIPGLTMAGKPATPVATMPVATTLSATPSTMSTAAADLEVKKVHLTAGPATQPADLAAVWRPIITRGGVDPIDADVISRVIEQYAFDAHRLTAVYVLDDAEFDRMVQLEVVPQPAKITRFGLVIVLNADPAKGSALDDLIVQLGDDDWSRRDAAYHALAAIGPAASEKLKTASKSSDMEVVWRAERLLAQMPATGK